MNKEIIDGNKLIAEFMQLGGFDDGRYGWMWNNPTSKNGSCFSLEYHSSWDWLIPVIEKIESLAFQVIMTKPIAGWSICTIKSEKLNYTEEQASSVKINSVHKAVINFIKWYNEQNKNE